VSLKFFFFDSTRHVPLMQSGSIIAIYDWPKAPKIEMYTIVDTTTKEVG